MPSIICLSLAAALITATSAFQPLNPLQDITVRNPYFGGFALPESNLGCPANTETCDGSFCCPLGTWCGPAINGPYCCPTNEDCMTQVNDLPTCADPSWTLFQDVYPWCCADGQIGIGGQVCADPAVSYSADDYAETETQANTAQPPATRSSVSIPGSAATTTADSGLAGAAATATTTGASSGSSPTSKASAGSSLKVVSEIMAAVVVAGVLLAM